MQVENQLNNEVNNEIKVSKDRNVPLAKISMINN